MWQYVPAAMSVIGGIISASNSRSNANAASQASAASAYAAQSAANQNAVRNFQVGSMQASMIGAMGRYNSLLQMASARANSDTLLAVAAMNQQIQHQTTQYNLDLLADELPALMNAYGLESEKLQQMGARQEGAIIAHQAASGTLIGEGSNADVVIDHQAQVGLEAFILRHNFDTAARNVSNAMAKNSYEGQFALTKLDWEARLASNNVLQQGQLNAMGVLGQAQLDSAGALYNAQSTAFSLRSAGQANYLSGMSQASAQRTTGANTARGQITAGILSGIGEAARSYATSNNSGNSLLT